MKKLLSLTLAIMLGMAAFAQDAIFYDFENGENGWTVGAGDEIFIEPYNNWFVNDLFGNGNNWFVSFAGDGQTVNHQLFSPVWSLTNANASGSVSFGVYTLPESSSVTNFSSTFQVYLIVDNQPTLLDSPTINPDMGYKVINITFQSLINAGVLSLSSTPANVQFAIQHTTSVGGTGAILLDDFLIRKRSDAFFTMFSPYTGSGEMDNIVSSTGGSVTLPNSTFTAPAGQAFGGWLVYVYGVDPSNESFIGAYEAGENMTISSDVVAYAIFGKPYTINYNANGGSGSMNSVQAVQGWGHVCLENGFTAPAGKHFAGWSDNPAGSAEILQPGDYCDIEDDDTGLTLYAIWEDGEDEGGNNGGGNEGGNGGGNEGGNGGGNEGGNGGGTSAIDGVSMANISIYPNPTQNIVRINGVSVNSLEVMDLTGRKVLRNEGVNVIDLTGLNNGVYMLRVNANEGTTIRKIVKK